MGSSFRLDPFPLPDENAPRPAGADGLTSAVLLHNARWFIRIRWIVVAAMTVFGAAGLLVNPELLRRFGLVPPGPWLLSLAGILTLLNLASIRWIRRLSTRTPWPGVAANIWFQIASDLAVLTALVYRVGPTRTVIAFAYLFHITLACTFFGRRDSFLVTLLSALLFLTTVILECMGLLPHPSVLASEMSDAPGILPTAIFAVPTMLVWFIVWYLVSSISEAVRQRDRDLDAANRRLMRADQEKNMQVLRVTHDLKAPFSGIESNIQILKHSHWDETPENVRKIIARIQARATTLQARIADILTLGSLRAAQTAEPAAERVNLRELLAAVLQDVQGLAAQKQISVAFAACDVSVLSDPKQLKILFSNLVSNALLYSRDRGTVEVGITGEAKQAKVSVADHGIGINEKALPHVFEDFFRAQEAAAFNPNSTGLGLAIVRQIARNVGLTIAVESAEGEGTTFQVFIPTG